MNYEVVVDVDGEEEIMPYGSDIKAALRRFDLLARQVGRGRVFSVGVWEENRDGIALRIRWCEDAPLHAW